MATPHVLSLFIASTFEPQSSEQQDDGVTVASWTVCETLESGPNFQFIVEGPKFFRAFSSTSIQR